MKYLAMTVALTLAACATGGSGSAPTTVTSPPTSVGPSAKLCDHDVPLHLSKATDDQSLAHVGVYGPGEWNNGRCNALVVESVSEDGTKAEIIFVSDKEPQRFTASLYRGKIQFIHNGCNVEYVISGGRVDGTYYGGRTFATRLSRRA